MACRILLRASFLQNARGFRTISVIGGGLMGSGIAQVCIQHGYTVHLVDVNTNVLSASSSSIHRSLTRIVKKQYADDTEAATRFVDSCLSNLTTCVDLQGAVSCSDLIIEAVVEKLAVKHELFRKLDKYAAPEAILASNTSSLSLKEIGGVLDAQRRFAGLHFFQPVPVLSLVEVIRTAHTSDATFQALMGFAHTINKVPIACRDTPGFVVNRLLVPYLLEAMRLVDRGDSSTADVDMGMKLGAGHPMGPLELSDFVGLDTIQYICESLSGRMPNDPVFKCPSVLQKLVSQGKLGKKSGEGFYKYDAKGKVVQC
ncbi:Hydroxyacyl-Coenzyme A dehydrogenase [Paragonimus heterotremus]|uniref:3-hydroxyacyl-CoA dehydrogenase n=1 Tax=Paragonimus heterotremus TaxID=100268 RepID=A0A8J4WFU5_9TREM|nr:Hydroxyacyl-Coenzyme A dehydrogenase [Paragonimus heterotremus]